MTERADVYPNATPARSGIPQPSPSDADLLRAFVRLAGLLDDGEACALDPVGACDTHSGGTPCEIAALRLLVRACAVSRRRGLHRSQPNVSLQRSVCEVCYEEAWPCPTEILRELGIVPDRGSSHA